MLLDDAIGDLRRLPDDDTDTPAARRKALHAALRSAVIDRLLDTLSRLGESLHERQRLGSGANEGGEEGEEGVEGRSLKKGRPDQLVDAGEDRLLDVSDGRSVGGEEGRDRLESEGEEVDIGVVDEGLEVGEEGLRGGRRESRSRAREKSLDAGEGGDLERAVDLAEEGGDLDEALLDPGVEGRSLAYGRVGDLSHDLDGVEARDLVLEPVAEESERGVVVRGELISSVVEESPEANDSLALDFLVGVAARQALHRRGVEGVDPRDDGGRGR